MRYTKLNVFFWLCTYYCATVCSEAIEIITLDPVRWQEYKALRLRALAEQPHAFGMSVEDERAHADRYWQNILDDAVEGKNRWVVCAQLHGNLVGMAGAVREWNGYRFVRHVVTIVNVYVAPEARGQKIAQRLMQELCTMLERDTGVEQALLWVTITQKDAISLYQKCGFTISGTLSRAIKIGDEYYDNYLMERSFVKDNCLF